MLLLPMAAGVVLYVPPVQDAAVRWVATGLTQRMGMEVAVERVRLFFPLHLDLRGLRIVPLLSIENMEADVRLRPLLRGEMKADYVSVRGIDMHLGAVHGGLQTGLGAERLRIDDVAYCWDERTMHVGRVLLLDGDIELRGSASPPKEERRGMQPLSVSVGEVRLVHIGASCELRSLQLQSLIDEVALHGVAVDTALHIALQHAEVRQGECALQGKGLTEDLRLTRLNAQIDSLRYNPAELAVRITQLTCEETHGMVLQEGTMEVGWREGVLSIPHLALRTAHSALQGQLRMGGSPSMDSDGEVELRLGQGDVRLLGEWLGGKVKELTTHYPAETLSASLALEGTMGRLHLTRCHITLPTAFDLALSGTVQGLATPQRCVAQGHIEAHTDNLGFLAALLGEGAMRLPTGIGCRGDIGYAPDTLHARCVLSLGEGTATIEAGYRPTRRSYELLLATDSLDLQALVPEGKWGRVTLQAYFAGCGVDFRHKATTAEAALQLHSLQWGGRSIAHTSAQASLGGGVLRARATCNDPLMQWRVATSIQHSPTAIRARLDAVVGHLDLRALQLADSDIHPAVRCHATLAIDSGASYALHARLTDIVLSSTTQRLQPRPLDLQARLTTDTALLEVRSGDLALLTSAHLDGLPWSWEQPLDLSEGLPRHLSTLRSTLSAGDDNPVSNYLALMGITFSSLQATLSEREGALTGLLLLDGIAAKGLTTDSLALHAHYVEGRLQAHLQSDLLTWSNPQMQLRGRAEASLTWGGDFEADSLRGMLRLSSLQYSLPAYSLYLHTGDTLCLPLERGGITFSAIPLYTAGHRAKGGQPLLLEGRLMLLGSEPTLQLHLTTRDTPLLQETPTRESILYGRVLVSGSVVLSGPFEALSIAGDLRLRPGSSIHYVYKDAILTAGNQLDKVVTFVRFDADTTALPKSKLSTNNLSMNLTIAIDPTARLEASLGASKQNDITLQGGGTLNLQYIPATGLRLAGSYTIETGELNMNVPLLHVSHMAIRQGSTVAWSGNPQNPQLDITAEERIRASVTLDGSPQSVLFVAGLSLTDTMDKLGVLFTLAAPENASMQNTLTTLSAEERGKLAVALLTTGLYLGEGGTGNLMNTALMSILQSQIDNISRDAFRTVDVSVGIEPLPDGVSGVSTRTDYSFSIAKRLWNNRIRIIIGGSVTTSNERIEEDAAIDNISIEWRINPVGNQYLRFFYDKNYESILEGEIRETGVGYAYRRKL